MILNDPFFRSALKQGQYGRAGVYGAARLAKSGLYKPLSRASGYITGAGKKSMWQSKGRGGPANASKTNPDKVRQRKQRRRKYNKCRNLTGMKLKKEVCDLKNAVKELKYSENASLGQMTHRYLQLSRVIGSVGALKTRWFSANDASNMNSVLSNLKFLNPSTGALVTTSGATGSYQRNVLFKHVTSSVEFRNNYQSDVRIKVYLCTTKDDTSIDPETAWSDGYADGGNASAVTDLNQYPTDYDVVTDLWNMKLAIDTVLSPGRSVSTKHFIKNIEFDPATYDSHNLTYQKEYKSFGFLLVLEGTIAHDTSTTEVGLLQTGVDIIWKRTNVVSYNAGVNIKYIHLDTSSITSFTNTGVQSHQPIPDNIGYSQS